MVKEDLIFFNEVRNNSVGFLHDNTKYSLKDNLKWFIGTNPKFFIVSLFFLCSIHLLLMFLRLYHP